MHSFIRHATYAYCQTGDELFRIRIEETIAWLQREMLVDGRFASSLDADSEGEEGRFYVWDGRPKFLMKPEFAAFRQVYDVNEEGNWEGKDDPQSSPLSRQLSMPDIERQLRQARQSSLPYGRTVFVPDGMIRH